jgi:hypothetical protein
VGEELASAFIMLLVDAAASCSGIFCCVMHQVSAAAVCTDSCVAVGSRLRDAITLLPASSSSHQSSHSINAIYAAHHRSPGIKRDVVQATCHHSINTGLAADNLRPAQCMLTTSACCVYIAVHLQRELSSFGLRAWAVHQQQFQTQSQYTRTAVRK